MKFTGFLNGEDGKSYPFSIEVGEKVVDEPSGPTGTAISAKVSPAGAGLATVSALVTPIDAAGHIEFRFAPIRGAEVPVVRVTPDEHGVAAATFVASTESDVVAQAHFIPADETKYTRSSSQEVLIAKVTAGTPTRIPSGTNTVHLNGFYMPVAGVDPADVGYPAGRGPDQLMIYTKPMAGTNVTGANSFGFEVVVRDGMVVRTGTNVAFDPPEYVLSAHNQKGNLLKASAPVGAKVVLSTIEAPKDPIPSWVVGGYWQQYEGPALSTLMVEAPQYNLLWCAFAIGNGGQRMTFQPYVQSDQSFKADLKAYRANGGLTGISIGGGVTVDQQGRDMRTYIRTSAEATAVFNSLVPIIDTYGFQGVDDDLENGLSGFTYDGLAYLFEKLRNKYGNDFVLASTPRPYENFRIAYAAKLYKAGLLDLLQWQFYDSMEYRDVAYLSDRIVKDTASAVAQGVPLSAQIVGCITRNGYQYGWNTIAAYENTIKPLKAKGLRGAFIWEASMDRAEKWSFAKRIGALKG